jgi:CelD/BcsL family acetyltransferase involved in cellulose biosynthesis
MHDEWDVPGFGAPPVAPHIGPFASAPFLEVWARCLGSAHRVVVVEGDAGLLALAESVGAWEFAGDGSVTDYHSPLGEATGELLADFLASLPAGTAFSFDSLPREAADVVAKGVELAGVGAEPVRHEVAPVITLPATYEEYLAGLGKKERHETRRKRRRFEAALGPARLERVTGPAAVETFVDMHRTSAGEKGSFMDETTAAFFAGLHERCHAVIDVLFGGDDTPRAAAFGFEDADTYYLYNSAYEAASRDHSPGIVLLEMLIRAAVRSGRTRFDLLKGDEPYKHRLGADPRPLFVIAGATGGAP